MREQILEHLSIHPDAADTVAGIASWWLEDEEEVAIDAVERAVEELVEIGVMERRMTPDGAAIYGLARQR